MKTLGELKQNSEEWHQWRAEGIGASEANIIMGASKFMTPRQLWHQKVYGKRAEEKTGNFITDKGHRLEAKARPLFEMEIGEDFPDMIAVMESAPVFRASLDGYSSVMEKCWECKFVGQDDFEKVKNGEVLENYFPQLQHQLMVTGARSNYLFVIADDKESTSKTFPYKTAYIEVEPDEDYIKTRLLPELTSFWKMVTDKKEPKLTDLDVVDYSDNAELIAKLELYRAQKTLAEEAKSKLDELQKDIYKIAKHTRNTCRGIKITNTKSADSVKFDYKKFEEENEIPESYMKISKGRNTKRITFPKDV